MYFSFDESWVYSKIYHMVKDINNKPLPRIICRIDATEHGDLIAAAPDLLMACKAVKGLLEGLDRTKGNVYRDIKEAINKAEEKEI